MRTLIITLVILALLAGGYYYLSEHARVEIGALKGEMEKAKRGDLVVPITASGNIQPASITTIKSEASGEVISTPFEEGMMVHKGDIIIQLDEADEQRNVDRAEAERRRAEIALARAQVALKERQEVSLIRAQAQLTQAEARRDLARIEWDHQQNLREQSEGGRVRLATPQEYETAKARLAETEATVKASEAEVEQARIAIEMAKKEVEAAEMALVTAEKTYEDTVERRSETTIKSPIDGMVLSRRVREGEMVLSGTQTFGGGTVLMELADVSDIYAVVNVDEADIGHVRELAPLSARPGPTATRPAGLRGGDASADEDKPPLASMPSGLLEEGDTVEVTVESFPDDTFDGVIERISPQSEVISAIATFKVRIRIVSDNRDKLVGLLNTHATARFTVQRVTDALLVSYDAVQREPNGEEHGVFIPVQKPGQEKPEPEFVPCEFGVDDGIWVEVLDDCVQEGQEVYTKLPIKTKKEMEEEEDEE